jgi:hypothetical protein
MNLEKPSSSPAMGRVGAARADVAIAGRPALAYNAPREPTSRPASQASAGVETTLLPEGEDS